MQWPIDGDGCLGGHLMSFNYTVQVNPYQWLDKLYLESLREAYLYAKVRCRHIDNWSCLHESAGISTAPVAYYGDAKPNSSLCSL